MDHTKAIQSSKEEQERSRHEWWKDVLSITPEWQTSANLDEGIFDFFGKVKDALSQFRDRIIQKYNELVRGGQYAEERAVEELRRLYNVQESTINEESDSRIISLWESLINSVFSVGMVMTTVSIAALLVLNQVAIFGWLFGGVGRGIVATIITWIAIGVKANYKKKIGESFEDDRLYEDLQQLEEGLGLPRIPWKEIAQKVGKSVVSGAKSALTSIRRAVAGPNDEEKRAAQKYLDRIKAELKKFEQLKDKNKKELQLRIDKIKAEARRKDIPIDQALEKEKPKHERWYRNKEDSIFDAIGRYLASFVDDWTGWTEKMKKSNILPGDVRASRGKSHKYGYGVEGKAGKDYAKVYGQKFLQARAFESLEEGIWTYVKNAYRIASDALLGTDPYRRHGDLIFFLQRNLSPEKWQEIQEQAATIFNYEMARYEAEVNIDFERRDKSDPEYDYQMETASRKAIEAANSFLEKEMEKVEAGFGESVQVITESRYTRKIISDKRQEYDRLRDWWYRHKRKFSGSKASQIDGDLERHRTIRDREHYAAKSGRVDSRFKKGESEAEWKVKWEKANKEAEEKEEEAEIRYLDKCIRRLERAKSWWEHMKKSSKKESVEDLDERKSPEMERLSKELDDIRKEFERDDSWMADNAPRAEYARLKREQEKLYNEQDWKVGLATQGRMKKGDAALKKKRCYIEYAKKIAKIWKAARDKRESKSKKESVEDGGINDLCESLLLDEGVWKELKDTTKALLQKGLRKVRKWANFDKETPEKQKARKEIEKLEKNKEKFKQKLEDANAKIAKIAKEKGITIEQAKKENKGIVDRVFTWWEGVCQSTAEYLEKAVPEWAGGAKRTMRYTPAGAVKDSFSHTRGDYLAEGGILQVLLGKLDEARFDTLPLRDLLTLFYVLSYIHGVYLAKYPEGTPRMEDNDYVLYSKVESELAAVVPRMMEVLKDTYEWWLMEAVVGIGGYYFGQHVEHFQWSNNSPEFLYFRYPPGGNLLYPSRIGAGSIERPDQRFLSPDAAPGEELYRVPFKPPSMPKSRYDEIQDDLYIAMAAYERLYGPVDFEAITRWTRATDQLYNVEQKSGQERSVVAGVIKLYKNYLYRITGDWRTNMATVSILLNYAHNTGSMAEYFGFSDLETRQHTIREEDLAKLSNLDQYVPEGDDYKTLKFIYNNWDRVLTGKLANVSFQESRLPLLEFDFGIFRAIRDFFQANATAIAAKIDEYTENPSKAREDFQDVEAVASKDTAELKSGGKQGVTISGHTVLMSPQGHKYTHESLDEELTSTPSLDNLLATFRADPVANKHVLDRVDKMVRNGTDENLIIAYLEQMSQPVESYSFGLMEAERTTKKSPAQEEADGHLSYIKKHHSDMTETELGNFERQWRRIKEKYKAHRDELKEKIRKGHLDITNLQFERRMDKYKAQLAQKNLPWLKNMKEKIEKRVKEEGKKTESVLWEGYLSDIAIKIKAVIRETVFPHTRNRGEEYFPYALLAAMAVAMSTGAWTVFWVLALAKFWRYITTR